MAPEIPGAEPAAPLHVPRRIHIVGAPGSGKSTLAHQLGATLGLRVYELDAVAYEGPEYARRRLEDRVVDVDAIARAPEWIAEGIHLGWTRPLLQRADLIIWLDHMSWLRSSRRIVWRFIVGGILGTRVHRGWRKVGRFGDYRRQLRLLMSVLTSSRAYFSGGTATREEVATREAAERELEPYGSKVVRCRSARDIQRLRARLAAARSAPLGAPASTSS